MATVEETKELTKKTEIKTVYDFMEKKKDLIARALPATITPDRLIGVLTMLMKSSPELMKCTQPSLIGAVIQTVQLGLTPGNIGHCHYVPFRNKDKKTGQYRYEVQFIMGYRGIVELVNRSGKASILSAECVHEGDEFEHEQGLNPILRHKPAPDSSRGEVVGVYCIAKNLVANEKVHVYLSREDIDKVKNASKAGSTEYSPWNTWYKEMAKKTAIKRICKLLPLSIEVQKKVETDETVKTTIEPDMTDAKDDANWEGVRAKAEDAQVVEQSLEEQGKELDEQLQQDV